MSIGKKMMMSIAASLLFISHAAFPEEGGSSHMTHSKQMKNDTGVKEGEAMADEKASTPKPAPAGKAAKGPTHQVHSKQMKNDTGVKDGEPMANDSAASTATTPSKAVSEPSHNVHSKQMKNDTGVKDGEPMSNP